MHQAGDGVVAVAVICVVPEGELGNLRIQMDSEQERFHREKRTHVLLNDTAVSDTFNS